MDFVVLGWPEAAPRLRLDYRRFSYAGKFVTGRLGIAVVRGEPAPSTASLPSLPEGLEAEAFADDVLAAVAFNVDRTDASTLWLRYLTVRRDCRASGQRLGPRLAIFITNRAAGRGYDRVRIAVNNVFAYRALSRAGFAYTGRETGLAELVLERPAARPADSVAGDDTADDAAATARYRRGLAVFRDREGLSAAERAYLDTDRVAEPPALLPTVADAIDDDDAAGDDAAAVDDERTVDTDQRPSGTDQRPSGTDAPGHRRE